MKEFHQAIFAAVYEKFKSIIEYSFHIGVAIFIPGLGLRVVRTFLAAMNADQPALHAMLCTKGQSNRGCHICCFRTKKNSVPYDPAIHKDRDFHLQLRQQQLAQTRNKLTLAGGNQSLNHTSELSKASTFCKQWGLHEYPCALYGIPIGYPDPVHIFRTAVCDLFHDLDSGIFKAVNNAVIQICKAFADSQDKFTRALVLIDRATSRARMVRHPPEFRHYDYTTQFGEGLATKILSTIQAQENRGATGSSGHARSSWSKVMTDAILTVLGGTKGTILPDEDIYEFVRNVRANAKQNREKFQKTIQLRNIRRICCLALYSVLDFSMEMLREKWTTELVTIAVQKARAVQSTFIVLYQNMVTICRNEGADEDKYEVSGSIMRMTLDNLIIRVSI